MMRSEARCSEGVPESVTVHVGDIEPLFEWAEHTNRVSTVVIAPVEIHRRNVKIRLTDANLPLDAFAFTGPGAVASQVLESGGKSSKALDRVDRLALLGDILCGENEATAHFRLLLGGEPAQNADAIEQSRREIELTTNYHPVRMRALRRAVEAAPSPIDLEAGDVIDGTLAAERALRRRSEKSPSDGEIIRRATRAVTGSNGATWDEAYPSVERVAVVGLSTIPATVVDLITAVTSRCDVDAHVFLRRGTGRFLERRLRTVWSVSNPGRVVVA